MGMSYLADFMRRFAIMTVRQTKTPQIFISYSLKDAKWLNYLLSYLSPYFDPGKLSTIGYTNMFVEAYITALETGKIQE